MRNKNRHIFIILTISVILGFIIRINPIKADMGQYELRTDPLDPFMFVVDTIYVPSTGDISFSGDNYFYHQVNLEAGNHYILYLIGGYIAIEDTNFYFHSAISTSIDEYLIAITETRMEFVLYLNPTTTGLYNLTIWCNAESGTVGHYGMGFLNIPEVPLDTEMTSDYWDFISNSVFAVIMDLESGKEYQTGYNGTHAGYSGMGDLYYCHVNQLYSIPYLVGDELDGSHTLMGYSTMDIITTNNLGQGSGKYLFYSLDYYKFSLMEAIEDITPPPVIPGYSILILGFVSISVILLLTKKFKS